MQVKNHRMAKLKRFTLPNIAKDAEQRELSQAASETIK